MGLLRSVPAIYQCRTEEFCIGLPGLGLGYGGSPCYCHGLPPRPEPTPGHRLLGHLLPNQVYLLMPLFNLPHYSAVYLPSPWVQLQCRWRPASGTDLYAATMCFVACLRPQVCLFAGTNQRRIWPYA